VTTYTYDDADRLTGIDGRTSGNAVIAAYDYTLDNNGNRISIDKNIPAAGTLSTRNETATYSRNPLTSTDTALYDYDNEGQLSSKQEGGTTTYSFDKAYRLTGIGNDTFAYDGAGNRLRAVRSGVETRYIYDANGNLLAEADGSNTITRYYVHGAGLLAAITPANDLYCYHYNATGNTVAITDSSETVVNSYDYSPFGMIISESEGFAQPFKYVGRLGVMSEGGYKMIDIILVALFIIALGGIAALHRTGYIDKEDDSVFYGTFDVTDYKYYNPSNICNFDDHH